MPQLLGEDILPDSVNSQRRKVRERVSSFRQPLKNRRQDAVPGPDLVGSFESKVKNLRSKAVSRDGLAGGDGPLSGDGLANKLMNLRDSGGSGSGSNGSPDNSGSDVEEGGNRGSSAEETITT